MYVTFYMKILLCFWISERINTTVYYSIFYIVYIVLYNTRSVSKEMANPLAKSVRLVGISYMHSNIISDVASMLASKLMLEHKQPIFIILLLFAFESQ